MRRLFWPVGIVVFTGLSCMYSFKGFFPSDLRKVWVPVFENTTLRYGLENYVTESFQDEIVKDGRLEVSDSTHAGMKLVGKVTDYKKEPFSYDERGKILEYKITITAEIGFLRLSNKKYYLEPATFTGWGLYDADTEEEEDGIKKAVKDLTDNVLRALFSKEF